MAQDEKEGSGRAARTSLIEMSVIVGAKIARWRS